MAEKKKRKSIYDKPLKDINKDGKVNFGDTWLGDALGFDGKVGIQKGRPGLKESLKGARRGSGGTSKKEDKPSSRPRSRPSRSTDSGVDAKAAATRRSEGPKTKRVTDSGMGDKAARTAKSKVDTDPSPDTFNVMLGKMSKQQKERFDSLPANQKRQVYRRYRDTGQISIPKGKPVNTNSETTSKSGFMSGTRGMAKGGMARFDKTGKRDYKGKGMFYDSKSPRGYK